MNFDQPTPICELDCKLFINSTHGHNEHQVNLKNRMNQHELPSIVYGFLTIAPLVLANTGANFLVLGSLKNQIAATVL